MSKKAQKTLKNNVAYSNVTNSYSHNQMVLPYNYQVEKNTPQMSKWNFASRSRKRLLKRGRVSEDCLRQFLNIVERRLKKE